MAGRWLDALQRTDRPFDFGLTGDKNASGGVDLMSAPNALLGLLFSCHSISRWRINTKGLTLAYQLAVLCSICGVSFRHETLIIGKLQMGGME